MSLVLPACLCLACGFCLINLNWERRAPFFADLLLRVSISVGYGLAIFSAIFLFSRIVSFSLLALDFMLFAILLAALLLLRSCGPVPNPPAEARQELAPSPLTHRTLTAVFVISVAAAIYAAITRALAHPHGDGWDAFAIWNLHARFLFRAGPHWRDLFSPAIPWSHPDYPLLIPAAVAHFWTFLGHDAPAVPAIISLLFAFTTVGILFSGLFILRGRTAAMLGALVLLSTPFFIEQSAAQYVDIPLSFFFLASIVFLSMYENTRAPALLAQAGLAVGFAAWTKNEGLLFLGVLFASLVLTRFQIGRDHIPRPRNRRSLLAFLVTAAPACLLVLWFKHSLAPPGDLFSDPVAVLHKLRDPHRYWIILQWYAKTFLRFGHWLLIPATLLLLCYYFVVRQQQPQGTSAAAVRSSSIALALTLAGYFAIYVITPYDLYWHLRFSLDRLFLQLWPSTIFLFFMAIPRLPVSN